VRPRLSSLRSAIAIVVGLVVLSSSASRAQIAILPTPTPAPSAKPPGATLTPPPSQSDDPGPISTVGPLPPRPTGPTGTEAPKQTPDPSPLVKDELPEGLEEALEIPALARTPARNTTRLIRLLEPLSEFGVPLESVLIEGMGRFPIAGIAHYSDDWLNPRFTPEPHLHKGLDIFADFGTPIRSPDDGIVTQLSDSGAGGTAVWLRGRDGTAYYFAHMLERSEGITVGARVRVGSLLGYVGDSGNAAGGSPHTHMQIHRGGVPVPPKTIVDSWLDEAEGLAPRWVDAQRRVFESRRRSDKAGTTQDREHEAEPMMLLTLLDPIGGSVAMASALRLHKRSPNQLSERVLKQLIDARVGGGLFAPKAQIKDQ
jgi:murein DD-endopeptidase MepM/ murein hydrolase activator NlpD